MSRNTIKELLSALNPVPNSWQAIVVIFFGMRRFRIKKGSLTKGQIVVATAFGVISGVYVWRPFFEERLKKPKNQEAKVAIVDPESSSI